MSLSDRSSLYTYLYSKDTYECSLLNEEAETLLKEFIAHKLGSFFLFPEDLALEFFLSLMHTLDIFSQLSQLLVVHRLAEDHRVIRGCRLFFIIRHRLFRFSELLLQADFRVLIKIGPVIITVIVGSVIFIIIAIELLSALLVLFFFL